MNMDENNRYIPEIIDETERLIIRELAPCDIPAYHRLIDLCGSEAVSELAGLSDAEFTERHMAYIRYQYGFYGYGIWGLFLKNGTLIGIAGVHNSDTSGIGELCYAVLPEYRRQGYAAEALRCIIGYALSEYIGFDGLIARIAPSNTASLCLAEKLGITVVSCTDSQEEP